MKQQIVVSGTGGQGVVFLTRVIAEGALLAGASVLTSETHGMAMRGGTVISHVKVGDFTSPLIRAGRADAGIFLTGANLAIHGHFVRAGGVFAVNGRPADGILAMDAASVATALGAPVNLNLVLLGFAAGKRCLFGDAELFRESIRILSPSRHAQANLEAFAAGLGTATESSQPTTNRQEAMP